MEILFVIDFVVPFGPNDLLAYKTVEELLRFGHQVLVSPGIGIVETRLSTSGSEKRAHF